jgi:rRNA biogenesis protein RRP5
LKSEQALTGAVKSIEDHGYVLDLGLGAFDGFLDFADVAAHGSDKTRKLELGQLVKTTVLEIPEHGRNCQLTVNPSALKNACVRLLPLPLLTFSLA